MLRTVRVFWQFFFFNLLKVSCTEFFPFLPESCSEMCHCGISTVLYLRQKSLTNIDSYRQLSTSVDRFPATERGKYSQRLRCNCWHRVIIYVPFYISGFHFFLFLPFWPIFLPKQAKKCVQKYLIRGQGAEEGFWASEATCYPFTVRGLTASFAAASLNKTL